MAGTNQFLTYEEIQHKCKQLSSHYEIDGEMFYQVVENWANLEISTEDKLLHSFSELLDLVSKEITNMEEVLQMRPTCRMGCAFCCYFPIIINEMEAKLMKKAIGRFPAERRDRLYSHLNNYYKQYGRKVEELTALNFGGDDSFKSKYINKQLPCVMLDTETNQCMAYEIRPIPCRTYMNYTDPNVCADNKMPKETVSFEFLYEQYMGALNEFMQFLYEEGNTGFIDYPTDVYPTDYLGNWFRPSL